MILVALVFFGVKVLAPKSQAPEELGASGIQFQYNSATIANSAVTTTWSVAPVLAADSSRGYASFCNESATAGNGIYLGLGATSTGISGIKITANTCYEMTLDKMFYGDIYAIASPTASQLLKVYK